MSFTLKTTTAEISIGFPSESLTFNNELLKLRTFKETLTFCVSGVVINNPLDLIVPKYWPKNKIAFDWFGLTIVNELKNKIEDIKVIDRAKCCLIEKEKQTEDEVHKYIEKLAMDMRLSRREIADKIIERYLGK